MENASKAIVIAGSILVAVMLVSLGVLIFNMAKEPVISFGYSIEDLAKNFENQGYTMYIGSDKRKTDVEGILDKVYSNNSSTNSSYTVDVKLEAGGEYHPSQGMVSSPMDIMNAKKDLAAKNTVYDIGVTDIDSNGIISEITIKGKSTK